MSEAECRDDDARLRKIFGYLLRDHVAYQDGRNSEAPSVVFADGDYEVGDGTCGLHPDGKRCNEPAIIYARADALVDALSRAEKAEAERDALRDREKHFASVLSVADGGQYRNDWDAAIRRVVAERDALRAAINRAGALACQRASHAFIIDALKEDKNA